jgi:hypothetical protein
LMRSLRRYVGKRGNGRREAGASAAALWPQTQLLAIPRLL